MSSTADMVEQLRALLERLYPDSYAALAAPADLRCADELPSFPAALRVLYAWADGCESFVHGPGISGLDWLPLTQAVDERNMLLRLAKAGDTTFEETLLPLFGEGSGDFVCADLTSKADELILWRYFHEEPGLRKPKAKLDTLLKQTLAAIKKGKWRSGFEGEAGRERREKLRRRFETTRKQLDKPDPQLNRISDAMHALTEAGMLDEAMELADKALESDGERSDQFSYSVAGVRLQFLPVALERGDYAVVKRVAEQLMDVYEKVFDVWAYYFAALRGLGELDGEAARSCATRAQRVAAIDRLQLKKTQKAGYRIGAPMRRRAAAQTLAVARMFAGLSDGDAVQEAIAAARSVPGVADWVDKQIAEDAQLAEHA